MNKELKSNKKVITIAGIVIGFLLLISAGFLIIIGAVMNERGLIYAGIFLLILGTVIYFIIFIFLIKLFIKYSMEKK